MRSTDPLVTVLIPAFNVEHSVVESIRSITEQSYINLEILIVEDCSTEKE